LRIKRLLWDYPHLLQDEKWRARRIAEYFPFVADELTDEDWEILIKHLDDIQLPKERRELIKLMYAGE
jgi:hypothetical protein